MIGLESATSRSFLPGSTPTANCRAAGHAVARYLARPDLDPGEREVAERIAAARLGLYRVRAGVPGHSLELENLLTGASIAVASQTVSCEVVRWDVVLCRLMPAEPVATLWGLVLVYAPDEEPELRAELERLAAAYGLSHDPAGLSEVFRACKQGAASLRAAKSIRRAEPLHGRGRSGCRCARHVVAGRSRRCLLGLGRTAGAALGWRERGRHRRVLPAHRRQGGAARAPAGAAAERTFFESSYAGFPDRIGIGTFVLDGCELHFDAISEQRLELALELVSRRLAGNAALLEREIAPLDLDRPERQDRLGPSEKDVHAAGYLDEYLRRWLDEPLARLDGATPRAAASIPKLRGDLEFLLRAIENRAEHARRAGAAWPDVAWLRDELDPSSQLAA